VKSVVEVNPFSQPSGDLDIPHGFCHAPHHDIASPYRLWYAFGLLGQKPPEKRFLIK
jgi:hypothetical protein